MIAAVCSVALHFPPRMVDPAISAAPTDADVLAHGREILRAEGNAILQAAESMGD